ncbi:MAG: PepSY domain-containing protein [Chloroflexi bacterium]|nr:PepSY domain-containing protein [Chloroflexota bacterium]
MSQRTALLVTTALTVFVMVTLAGIAWQVFQKTSIGTQALQTTAVPQANAVNQPAVIQPAAPQVTNDAVPQDQTAERESAFQQLIQQANARLDQAYKQQQELAKQVQERQAAAQAATTAPQVAAQPAFKVTPQQALAIALAAVPGANALKPAELVSFHELPTYEVTLDKGVVYIDANSGEVVYNSAAPIIIRNSGGGGGSGGGAAVNNAPAAPRSGGEREHDDDHKSDDRKSGEHKSEKEHDDDDD